MISAPSLTERTAHAAKWRLAASVIGSASRFAIGVLLARLLTPADFGLMALAFVVLGAGRAFSDVGVSSALVQRTEMTERHVRAAFTFSVLLGMVVAATMVVAAPFGAVVMREPQVTPVVRVLAAGFAMGASALVARALLRRHLDFRRLFYIDTGSHLLGYGCVAVTLALRGYGVWSLVWGGLFQGVLSAAAHLASVRHPMRPLLGRQELRDLLHFGFGAHLSGLVNYIALNADNFIVGRVLGAASLGFYSRAYSLMKLPHTYGASVMSTTLFPAFSQMQRDPARLRRAHLLVTQLAAMVAAPAMVTIAIAAPHFVRGLYGERWMGAVVPLQILCVGGYFRALYHLDGVVVQSVGWVYKELWRQAGYAGLVIAGALLGSRHGLAGVATGVSAAILFMFIALGQLALRATEGRWIHYLVIQRDALVTGFVTGVVALTVQRWLEASDASSGVIALTVITTAAVPWGLGILWTLGLPDLEPARVHLPQGLRRTAEGLRSLYSASSTHS